MTRLVLASASVSRARLLENAGVPFAVHPAHVDEDSVKSSMLAAGGDGRAIADALAGLKAMRVSASQPDALVLGADQVLMFQGRLVSKVENIAAAAALLRELRGERHELITAAVLARDGVAIWRHVDGARLWMRDFSDGFLENYLETVGEEVLGSVGCYHLEGRGAQLFARIEGDYFSILGLPLLPLLTALRGQGVIAA